MVTRTDSLRGLNRNYPGKTAVFIALSVSVFVLAGCQGATYGTGKTTEQQLVEDVTGIFSFGGKERQNIDYKPRTGLVKPPSTAVLPTPQDSLASSSNPNWVESPEQRLARVRAHATAGQDDPNYRSPVVRDVPVAANEVTRDFSELSPKEQREEVQRRRKIANQGDPNTRRYLSEPPLAYRSPSESAAAGELGKDELQKEREAKRAAGGGGGIRNLWPF